MKIVTLIARLLLGLVFTVFGLNGFHPFLPMPPMTGQPGEFMTILFVSHVAVAVFAAQLLGGLLLLVNRFVPVALSLLGPVLVNILLFHLCIAGQGLPVPLVVTVLWFVVFYSVWPAFAAIFRAPGQA